MTLKIAFLHYDPEDAVICRTVGLHTLFHKSEHLQTTAYVFDDHVYHYAGDLEQKLWTVRVTR